MQRISVLISLVIVLQCLSLVVDCADYVQPSLDRPLFYSFVGHPEREEAYNLLVAQELEEREKSDAVHNASSGTLAREVSPPQFNCPKINCHKASSATTIRALTACDIAVIGALGDSLTAGFGAKSRSIFTIYTEYRGVSFSAGGDNSYNDGIITFPNILREYNSGLRMYSIGVGKEDSVNAQGNVAVSGAIASDIILQASILLSRMRAELGTQFSSAWKMINIFIGSNDLCAVCDDDEARIVHNPDSWEEKVTQTIDYIQENFPNTLVNLIGNVDVSLLAEIDDGKLCKSLHSMECPCAMASAESRELVSETARGYMAKAKDISQREEYNTDTFAVVYQPFLENTKPPLMESGLYDVSFFAVDCFHFSEKGHQLASHALWNNLWAPSESKTNSFDPLAEQEPLFCPTATTFIPTS